MVLGPERFRGVFSILPSPATQDAYSPLAKDTVNRDALRTLVNNLIEAGVHGIITTGSMGEAHTLLWEEHKVLIDTVVDAVNGRVPVIIGTWAPNTRESIMKTRYARDAGADGVMNGPPHYIEPTVENTIQYYRDLADACPEMAIMIYHNPSVFRITIPVERYEEIMKIPNVVAVKETLYDLPRMMLEAWLCKGRISFMCHSSLLYPCMMFGFTGAWDPTWVNCGPEPVLKLYKACEERDWEKAKKISEDFIKLDLVQRKALGNYSFSQYQVNWEHLLLNAAGYVQTGPARRPFAHVPEAVRKAAETVAEEYKKIRSKYKE